MICTTYFLTFFSELIPPTGYVKIERMAFKVLHGFIVPPISLPVPARYSRWPSLSA